MTAAKAYLTDGPSPADRDRKHESVDLCCAQLLRGTAARTTRKFDVAPTLSELREHAPCRRTRWIEHLRLELRTETQGGLVSPKPAATRSVGKEAVMLTCRRTTQGRSRARGSARTGVEVTVTMITPTQAPALTTTAILRRQVWLSCELISPEGSHRVPHVERQTPRS